MSYQSPFAAGVPGLVPITGPGGTYQIPAGLAGAFGMPEVPIVEQPEFTPDELAQFQPPLPGPVVPPAPLPAAPPSVGAVPGPSAQGAPEPSPQPQPDIEMDPAYVEPPAPGTLDATLQNIAYRQDVARRTGEAAAAGADREAAIYDKAAEDERVAEEERNAARKEAQAEIDRARAEQADAVEAYANHKVEQNRLWHNMGTGSKIMAGIGVALAGLGGALVARDTGRPVTNPALDMIMGAIQDDVRLQLADREKLGRVSQMKGDAVQALRQKFTDDESLYSAMVGGRAKRVALQIAAAGAQSKSEEVKLRAEETAALLNEEANQAVLAAQAREQQARQVEFDNRMKRSQAGLGWAQLREGQFRDRRDFEEQRRQFDLQLQANYEAKMAQAEAAKASGAVAVAKEIREQAESERRAAKDQFEMNMKVAEQKVYDPLGNELINKDPKTGKQSPWLAGDSKRAGEVQGLIGNVATMAQLTDDLVRLRDRHGWSSTLARSPEFQQMKSTFANMQLTEKDVRALGALTGSDLTILAEVLGTDDPTGVRDPTPGLRTYRKNAIRGLNNELRAKGYKGAPIDIPEFTKLGVETAAASSPTGQLIRQAQERVPTGFGGLGGAGGVRDVVLPIGDILARAPGPVAAAAPASASRTSGFPDAPIVPEDAERAIWGLVAAAGAGDKAALNALHLAADDPNPRIRELARQIAAANPGFGIKVKK